MRQETRESISIIGILVAIFAIVINVAGISLTSLEPGMTVAIGSGLLLTVLLVLNRSGISKWWKSKPPSDKELGVKRKLFARKRSMFLFIALLVVPVLISITSSSGGMIKNMPFGSEVLGFMVALSGGILVAVVAHFLRKYIFDYISADYNLLLEKAKETSTGAGLGSISVAVMFLGICIILTGIVMA